MWRDRDFRLFYAGQAVSLTGSAVTLVALPLLGALTLHASSLGIAALQACGRLPYLGLPLLAGVLVDRYRRRPVLIGANAVQAVLLGLVPVLSWAGRLSLPAACAIALGSGAGAVFFGVAELAYVPDLVGRDRLLPANAAIEAARSASTVLGRGLGGVVVQAIGAPLAVLVDAASYLVSVVTVAAIRRPEPAPPPAPPGGRPMLAELTAGLRFVFGRRLLLVITGWVLTANALGQAFTVPFLLYALRDRHLSAGVWGVVLATSGVTALVGAAVAPRLAARFGYGPTVVASGVLSGLPLVAVPAAAGGATVVVAVWIAAEAVGGLGVGTVNVMLSTLRTQLTPPELLGRVGAATRLLAFGAIPLGSLAGGALAGALGYRPSLWLLAALLLAANAFLVPAWRLRTLHAWQVPESSSSAA